MTGLDALSFATQPAAQMKALASSLVRIAQLNAGNANYAVELQLPSGQVVRRAECATNGWSGRLRGRTATAQR